ncbi:MAG: hypothetical protein IPM17_14705 [Verrucomicrobia bacterium]|nr:hypothetical protein [Verrucomicrobiota bacterium]
MRSRQRWTRRWRHLSHAGQRWVTSLVVQEEREQISDLKRREAALQLIQPLAQIEFTPAVDEIVAVYLAH